MEKSGFWNQDTDSEEGIVKVLTVEWYGEYVKIPPEMLGDEAGLQNTEELLKGQLAEALKQKITVIRHFGDIDPDENTIAVRIGIFAGEPDEGCASKIYAQNLKKDR